MGTRTIAVSLLVGALGCTPPPAASLPSDALETTAGHADPRAEVLGGLLSFEPPRNAEVLPNVADSIMAAAPSAASQTRVRWQRVGVDGMVSFYRDRIPCTEDFEASVRPIVEDWAKADGPYTLSRRANSDVPTLLYRPETSPGRDGIRQPMTAFLCAGEAGLVQALVFVGNGGTRVDDEALAMIDGLRPGSAGFDLPAHERPMPEACGAQAGVLHVPEGFAVFESVGADFEVVRVENVAAPEGFAALSLYTGDQAKRFAPGDAKSAVAETAGGIEVERARWREETGRVHFEVAQAWPSTPCARHVWAEAPDDDTLDLLWRVLR